jgi:hypothetical protein
MRLNGENYREEEERLHIYAMRIERSKIQKIVVSEAGQQNEQRGGTIATNIVDNLPTLQSVTVVLSVRLSIIVRSTAGKYTDSYRL